MLNALTIDVEDYFQVNAFAGCIRRDEWDGFPLRVGDNTRRILDMLDEFNVKGTFFVLGWVAERDPALVRDILSRGHEIASHGYGHELIYTIGPEAFRTDIRHSKQLLEDISGVPVVGYRAPSYSITGKSLWALQILVEEGFQYDSSIFPVYHDTYGMPDAPRFPHRITTSAGAIDEFPLSTFQFNVLGKQYRLPVAGGGYLRLLPAVLIGEAFQKLNKKENQPAVLYFHPWEIDPEQPRMKAGLKSRFRHYLNLDKTEGRLEHLIRSLKFNTMGTVLGGLLSIQGKAKC